MSDANGDGLVLTKSSQLYECDYPYCGKQFCRSYHLLRHQTQKHGRTPTHLLGLQGQDDMNVEQSSDGAGTVSDILTSLFLVSFSVTKFIKKS